MLLKKIFFALLFVCPCLIMAQGSASIAGMVSSEDSGDPVAQATISLLQDGAVVEQIQTNSRGGYYFSKIPAGNYQIQVTQRGYTPIVINHIHILAYQHFEINPSFEYGSYDDDTPLLIDYRDMIQKDENQSQLGIVNKKKRQN